MFNTLEKDILFALQKRGVMDEIVLLDAVERYLEGSMPEEERSLFEELRKNNAEVDQLVVSHHLFLQELNSHHQRAQFKHQLQQVHEDLLRQNSIKAVSNQPSSLRVLWKKYSRTIAVAASIGGITAMAINGLFTLTSPTAVAQSEVKQLARELSRTKQEVQKIGTELKLKDEVKTTMAPSKRDGTGFLIDGKGYLVTNVHVVKSADSVYVENQDGQYFKAAVVHVNDKTDLAILKIDDQRFIPYKSLPYGLKKQQAELGEEVFTLGFPRKEIVYGEGYLSAKTGFNGDTISYQVAISANPGNSGAPLFNNLGEVIGVVSGKQTTAEGVVFAVKANHIFKALETLKKDSSLGRIKPPTYSNVKYMNRVQQIKKLEDCIFIVKSY